MKKNILIIVLFLCTGGLFAQQEKKSMEQELEQSFQKMAEEMEQLFGEGSQLHIFTDTLFLQDMEKMIPQDNLEDFSSADIGQLMGDMMQLMQQQMQQLTDEDFQQFERLFEGLEMPMIPAPEHLEDDDKQPAPAPTEKKKQRKTYKL